MFTRHRVSSNNSTGGFINILIFLPLPYPQEKHTRHTVVLFVTDRHQITNRHIVSCYNVRTRCCIILFRLCRTYACTKYGKKINITYFKADNETDCCMVSAEISQRLFCVYVFSFHRMGGEEQVGNTATCD